MQRDDLRSRLADLTGAICEADHDIGAAVETPSARAPRSVPEHRPVSLCALMAHRVQWIECMRILTARRECRHLVDRPGVELVASARIGHDEILGLTFRDL